MSRANRVARVFCSFSRALELRADVRRLGAGGRVGAERLEQPGPLGGVALGAGRRRTPRRRSTRGRLRRAIASPMVRMRPGIAMTSRRRIRAPSSRASRRARPTCDWAARAAYRAIAGSIAVAADEQVGDRLDRRSAQPHVPRARAEGDDDVLERGRAEDPDGARGRLLEGLEQRVGGAARVSRSASSMMMTRHRPTDGRSAASWTRARVLLDLDRQALGRDDRRRRRGCRRARCGTRDSRRSRRPGTAAPRRTRGPRPTGPTRAGR